jgi:hypothetical protein
MRFQGDVTLEAPRERAWAFLTDPHRITRCAPEVQSLKIVDDRRFLVGVRAGVGPIKGTFTCAVMWLERHAPERARVQARCKIPASTVDLMTVMLLTDLDDGHTLLHWESDATIGGLLAGLSGPLIQRAADAVLQRVFARVNAELRREVSAPASPPA